MLMNCYAKKGIPTANRLRHSVGCKCMRLGDANVDKITNISGSSESQEQEQDLGLGLARAKELFST